MADENEQNINELIEQLQVQDHDWQTRQTAAQELGELGRQKKIDKEQEVKDATEALWTTIKQDNDRDVVNAAWEALKAIQKGSGEDWLADPGRLQQLLDVENWEVRQRAVKFLRELGPKAKDAAQALWTTIQNDNERDVVNAAWEALKAVQKGSEEDWLADAGKLQGLLAVENWEVRQRAAKSLQELGPQAKDAAQALWARIEQDNDPDVANAAWEALKAIQKDTGEDWLADADKLEQLLGALNWQVRERAAKSLQALGPKAKDAAQALWERIKQDDQDDVARAAWDAVKAIQKGSGEDWPTDTGKLKALLEANTPFARIRAAEKLASLAKANLEQLGNEYEQRRLKERLSEMAYLDDDENVRDSAMEAAKTIPRAVDPSFYSDILNRKLIPDLKSDNWVTRQKAAQALGELGRQKKIGKEEEVKALAELSETIKKDNDPDVLQAAWKAVKAIQEGGGEDWLADAGKLEELLEAKHPSERIRAAEKLASLAKANLEQLGTEDDRRGLKERLFKMAYPDDDADDDAEVRSSAMKAADAIPVDLPPSVYIPLLDRDQYGEEPTRRMAAQALGELGRNKKIAKAKEVKEALDALWKRIIKRDEDEDVVKAAWDAIQAIQEGSGGDWSAVPDKLKELLDDGEFEVRQRAAKFLQELGPQAKAALDALWKRIKQNDDEDVVKAAWDAIQAIEEGSGGDWSAVADELKALLDEEEWEVRQRATEFLQELGPQAKAALDALWKTIKQDDEVDVAMTAWEAVKAIQKGSGEDWLADPGKLQDLLAAKKEEVQKRAAKTAIQALVDQLSPQVEANSRKEAARKLGDLGPAAKKVLDGTYSDALGSLWPRMLDELWRRIKQDDDPHVAVAAWDALKAIPVPDEKDDEADWLADKLKLKELLDAKSPEVRQRAAKGLGQWLQAKKKNDSDKESLLERLWANVVEDEAQDVRLAAAAAIASGRRKEDLGRLVGVGEKIDLGQWLVASDPAGLKDKMWCADPQATVLIVLTVFDDHEQQDEQDRALWQEARRQAARWLVDRAKQLEADYSGDGKPEGDKHYEWLWLVRRLQQLRRKNCELDVQHSLTEALSALWPVFTKDLIEALKDFKPDQPHQDLRFDGLINQMLEYCRAERPSGHRRWRRSKNGQAAAHSAKDASDQQNAPEASDASDPQKTLERIAQLGFVESPDFVRVLVEHWVDWIADRDKPHLVETTAEAMRYNPEVIAHLLGQYDKDLEENKERFPQILFDTLQESFPGAFRYIQAQDGGKNSARNERIKELLEWLDTRRYMPEEYTQLLAQLKQELRGNNITKEAEILVKRMVDLLVRTRLKYREKVVRQRIAKQLALMSDRTRFERAQEDVYDAVADELQKHAVSQLGARLRREEDIETRRSMARTLANLSGRGVGGRDAVEALAEAVVGEERQQQRRQQMLNDYYLKPSRERSDEAAEILKGAVGETKKTLGLIQKLSSLVVIVGTVVLLGGLFFSFTGGDDVAQRVAGALAGLGGFAGVIAFLIRDPLNRIQNAVSNLVQLEAAFTSFIWELNLNSTYIQSQYVKKGELSDTDIARTVQRIEDAMSLAIGLVQRYTREGEQRITRINSLSPMSDQAGKQVAIYGQYLNGDSPQRPGGLAQLSPQASQTQNGHSHKIFVNHKPIAIEKIPYWTENEVHFELPTQLPDLVDDEGVIWLSLSIDGMETNALPFLVVKNQDDQNGAKAS